MLKKLLDNVVAIFVVIIIVSLLIPMPPAILDFLFIVNISISVVILLMSMYIREALEFSIFPSMLLVTTLFRLALNTSSTRLILTNAGEAGAVIKTFGEFVLQGNIVVGVIIFIIIVLVQFIVITKGAERVAEVSARFTLDAMPGKQMAIDADLSSGTITEQEARERREKIQGEADFYGAMDGSTKIVKGDAVMSIIITAINFIGGVTIGAVQGGMSFSEVIQVYSIATIGDGLVSQIPALLISSATGMIVTRSVSKGSLNDDVLSQFIAKPTVLILAGIMIGCIILIPGAPWIQPLLVSGGLIGIGMYGKKKQERALAGVGVLPQQQETATEVEFDENTYYKDINNIYALLTIEPIEMEFGYSLIPLVDEGSGGNLINRIVIFRRKLAQEMGFVVPSIRLRNSAVLNANEYVIKIKGEVISSGELLVDYYLALEPPEATGVIDGIETIEPA
ncbi:MAG: flagellar biosynthesis protein FlhA, partial [Oscillospiraceae bacterium]